MFRNIFIVCLVILVIGTGFWGYLEHREKNAILINAENQYQNAFHTLTYDIDLLHDKIGTTLAMNSQQQLSPALVDVWRLTSEAHAIVGQLPLSIIPFNKTEEFLQSIGDFSYKTAVRNLDTSPLSAEEYKVLQDLYAKSSEIQDELREVQRLVIKNNLRWMDVEMALAAGKKKADNTIIDGFALVEEQVAGYTEGNNSATFTSLQKTKKDLSKIEGEKISEEKALEIARSYSTFEDNSNSLVTKSGEGSAYEFYSVAILDPSSNNELNMDILVNGGAPIWLMNSEKVTEKKLSLDEGAEIAAQFLKDHEYVNMDLYESMEFNNVGVYTFVYTTEDIRIYSDNIKIKIALNDGHVLAFSAKDYLVSSKERQMNKPVLSEEEARTYINQGVQIMEHRLALIENTINEEVLCHEFLGVLNNDTYQIFINAENGMEEKVEKLTRANKVYESFKKNEGE